MTRLLVLNETTCSRCGHPVAECVCDDFLPLPTMTMHGEQTTTMEPNCDWCNRPLSLCEKQPCPGRLAATARKKSYLPVPG